jgi:hypothetical protein
MPDDVEFLGGSLKSIELIHELLGAERLSWKAAFGFIVCVY